MRGAHVPATPVEVFTMRTDSVLGAIRKVYGDVLDRLDVGIILLDAMGRPSFANSRAAAIAARGDGLSAGRTGVTASLPRETRALQAAVAAMTAIAADTAAADVGAAGTLGSRRVYLSRPS